ncbi:MAG TPA: sulfurtransferase TusA family protein [Caulobacteraceae bacterium]|jgi:tRNA 2-thiouridine synthesizing protein A|nr:sulfurtransferase TusA family protein [Caulobacteraceae bacterium]
MGDHPSEVQDRRQPITIDARGHRCPTPTLRLRRALEATAAGACVRLLADDPMARIDVPHFVREAGHELVEAGEADTGLSFLVRKRALPAPAV